MGFQPNLYFDTLVALMLKPWVGGGGNSNSPAMFTSRVLGNLVIFLQEGVKKTVSKIQKLLYHLNKEQSLNLMKTFSISD